MADILDRFRKKPKKIIRPEREQFFEKPHAVPDRPVRQPEQQPQQAPQEHPMPRQVLPRQIRQKAPPEQPRPQQPQQPEQQPHAPAFQKPQAPNPPAAPEAPPGKIELEKKYMGLCYARRARILYYLLGFLLLGGGGYIMLFNPMELSLLYAFFPAVYIAGALALLGLIVILFAEAKRRTAYYYITQYRIVESWGLIRKREHAIQLEQVESVRIRQGFLDRILGIGDVEVKTGRDSLTLQKVGNPGRAESLILSVLNRRRSAGS